MWALLAGKQQTKCVTRKTLLQSFVFRVSVARHAGNYRTNCRRYENGKKTTQLENREALKRKKTKKVFGQTDQPFEPDTFIKAPLTSIPFSLPVRDILLQNLPYAMHHLRPLARSSLPQSSAALRPRTAAHTLRGSSRIPGRLAEDTSRTCRRERKVLMSILRAQRSPLSRSSPRPDCPGAAKRTRSPNPFPWRIGFVEYNQPGSGESHHNLPTAMLKIVQCNYFVVAASVCEATKLGMFQMTLAEKCVLQVSAAIYCDAPYVQNTKPSESKSVLVSRGRISSDDVGLSKNFRWAAHHRHSAERRRCPCSNCLSRS
jgi:hypothetical protein